MLIKWNITKMCHIYMTRLKLWNCQEKWMELENTLSETIQSPKLQISRLWRWGHWKVTPERGEKVLRNTCDMGVEGVGWSRGRAGRWGREVSVNQACVKWHKERTLLLCQLNNKMIFFLLKDEIISQAIPLFWSILAWKGSLSRLLRLELRNGANCTNSHKKSSCYFSL